MTAFRSWLTPIVDRVLEGGAVTRPEARRMLEAHGPDAFDLFAGANRVRHEFQGADVHLCSIVNAKSGRCSEDCGFCSQSVRFPSAIPDYDLVGDDDVVEHAEAARARGSQALGIVAAWRGLKRGPQLDAVLDRLRAVASVGGIKADASLGLVEDPEIPEMLKDAGLHTYNHNLETSRRFFPEVCDTHGYEARRTTLKLMKAAGVRTCSGGVFGMGEGEDDRVDLAFELQELDVDVIPLNFLNPMEGTPMAERPLLEPMDALRTIAMFRFVHPSKEIMVAGGREVTLRELQPLMFVAGASATMAGHYLTSQGRSSADDHRMIEDLELDWLPPGHPRPEPQAVATPGEPIGRGVRFPVLDRAEL